MMGMGCYIRAGASARLRRGAAAFAPALVAALLVLAALAGAAGTAAAAGPLEVVSVGWDGNVAWGTWTPLRVRVAGGRSDATARVEVVLFQRAQQTGPNGPALAAYSQDVPLPAGVTKEVTLWAPVEANVGGTVRLTAGGRLLAEEPVEFKGGRMPGWPLVGVLADSPAIARVLGQIDLPLQQGLRAPLSVARLQVVDIPTDAQRLNGLKALVVQGAIPAGLTGEQRLAVQEWVADGGHLVLSGGPEAARAAGVLPPGALPVSFAGADVAADLGPLTRLVTGGTSGAPAVALAAGPAVVFQATGGAVLAGTPERPLAWRGSVQTAGPDSGAGNLPVAQTGGGVGNPGRGTVTVLAADLGLEPLASWSGSAALLRALLEPALPAPTDDERTLALRAAGIGVAGDPAVRLQGAVDALPPDAFLDWRGVALILGAFAFLVGPVVHVVLRRLDRREWVWLVVPASAVVVSTGLYVAGVRRGGRDVLVNVVSHVQIDPDRGTARQSVAAGFFAPTRSQLSVVVPGDTPVRTRAGGGVFGALARAGAPAATSEPPVRVVNGRTTRVEFVADESSMRTVSLRRHVDKDVGRISSSLTVEDGVLKGNVRNETPFLLEDAAVVVGTRVAKLGSLAPGQTAPVALDLATPSGGALANQYYGGTTISQRLLGAPVGLLGAGGVGGVGSRSAPSGIVVSGGTVSSFATGPDRYDLSRDPEVQRRARLVDAVLAEQPRYGPGTAGLALSVLAFTRAPVGADLPSAGNHPTYYLTLLQQPLRLSPPAGRFTVPPALAPGEAVGQAARSFGFSSSGSTAWMELQSGSVTYAFHPPLPARFQPETLVIATRQVGPNVSVAPGAQGRGAALPANAAAGPADAGVFNVYNWQTAAWEPLGAQMQARLESAAAYLGSDGTVRVQLVAPADRLVRVVPPEVTVEGTAT